MERNRLVEILQKLSEKKIAIVGDFCLDVYWHADMQKSELAREAPRFPLPIVEERYSPGAAGNVAWNAKDLGSQVYAVSVFGKDWRGQLLKEELKTRGIDLQFSVNSPKRVTPAYIKPLRIGYETIQEDSRLDFENYSFPDQELEDQLKVQLDRCLTVVDGVIIADQLDWGIISEGTRRYLGELAQDHSDVVFAADSRKRVGLFHNVILKPNEIEMLKWVQPDIAAQEIDLEIVKKYAPELQRKVAMPVYVTVASEGVLLFTQEGYCHIKQVEVQGEVDTVGAGDTFISAVVCALSCGVTYEEAGFLGNIASAVTVKKLRQTGTATAEEILAKYDEVFLRAF